MPAAIKVLDKIEISCQFDGVCRLDHAVTKTRKTILKAFGLVSRNVDYSVAYISECLKKNMFVKRV